MFSSLLPDVSPVLWLYYPTAKKNKQNKTHGQRESLLACRKKKKQQKKKNHTTQHQTNTFI